MEIKILFSLRPAPHWVLIFILFSNARDPRAK